MRLTTVLGVLAIGLLRMPVPALLLEVVLDEEGDTEPAPLPGLWRVEDSPLIETGAATVVGLWLWLWL